MTLNIYFYAFVSFNEHYRQRSWVQNEVASLQFEINCDPNYSNEFNIRRLYRNVFKSMFHNFQEEFCHISLRSTRLRLRFKFTRQLILHWFVDFGAREHAV